MSPAGWQLARLGGEVNGGKVMVTDKLASYGVAKREVMPEVEHRQHKGLNNRAENLYGIFRVKCSFASRSPPWIP